MALYDWEQDDAQVEVPPDVPDTQTRERDRSDMGLSLYKYPLYLDPDRLKPGTEERIEVMVTDGLRQLGEHLHEH